MREAHAQPIVERRAVGLNDLLAQPGGTNLMSWHFVLNVGFWMRYRPTRQDWAYTANTWEMAVYFNLKTSKQEKKTTENYNQITKDNEFEFAKVLFKI